MLLCRAERKAFVSPKMASKHNVQSLHIQNFASAKFAFRPTPTEDKALKNKNLLQAIKFTVFSLSAGAIQLGVNAIMYEVLHIDYWVSYLTALVLSVLWNFTFNRKFTFKSASNVPFAMFLVVCFYGVFTPLSTWWEKAFQIIMKVLKEKF